MILIVRHQNSVQIKILKTTLSKITCNLIWMDQFGIEINAFWSDMVRKWNYLDAELPNAKNCWQIFSFQDRRLVQPDVSDSSMSIWSVVVLIFGYLDQILGIKYARYHKIRQYRLTKVQEFIYTLLCDKLQLGWVAYIINNRWA